LHSQLPELYTTIQRDEASFPVQYLGANIPQAWAAGSVFALMEAMLGCMPDAPQGKLRLDPWLPEWLPDLTQFDVLRGDRSAVERSSFGARIAARDPSSSS
jgi:glycogen debranching enzyme